jgi:hypothetical protein
MVTVMLPSKDDPDKKVVKELSIKPKNILFDGHTILDESYKLMDLPDRLGSVPLHEVLMSQQVEAARLLCDKQNASLDVPDINGTTPRQLVFMAAQGGLISDTMKLVRDYAIRKQDRSRVCNKCQKVYRKGSGAEKFKRCSRCGEIYYCSRKCQVADWPEHKKTCVDVSKGIVLQNPDDAPPSVSSLFPETTKEFSRTAINRNGLFHDGSYQKPKHVATGEKFWVKVQITTSGRGPHWIYDYSRECSFHVLPGQPGYEELLQKVRLEPVSMGRKCHFKVYFDEAGQCTIFPFTAKLLEW